MIKKIYFIFIIIVLSGTFFSCSIGLKNGSDLIGKWELAGSNYSEYFTFYDDGTGCYSQLQGEWRHRDFTWDVRLTPGYRTIIMEGEIQRKYRYYFSSGKNFLYMKQNGELIFRSYCLSRRYK